MKLSLTKVFPLLTITAALSAVLISVTFSRNVLADGGEQPTHTQEAHSQTHDKEHENEHEHEHEHEEAHHEHDEHDHGEKQRTHIENQMASQVGISTTRASSQQLHQRTISYGSLSAGPEQISHVRARYSGLIRSVKPTIGDTIKQGDLLAEVESNESLKVYKILAPISGTIIQRHANIGEVTQNQILFSIANFDSLWAELRIYPSQQSSVKVGQPVEITFGTRAISGKIQHIIPVLDKPYQLARVKFDNRSKQLTPGLLVEGRIIVGEFSVLLAVEKNAVQTLGEQQGVFIQEDEEYEFAPLQLGRRDEHYVEVLSGLSQGQVYVNQNSYLIKADIEKSSAEHHH